MIPTVSVVMSCHNEEFYVGAAIQSILEQTYREFEFIIIDDASTDHTVDIIRSYCKQDTRIILLLNSRNLGLAASLNKGIRAAKGRYIARMDADDRSYPERLERQICFLNKNLEVDILGTAIYRVHKRTGQSIGLHSLPEAHEDIVKNLFKKPVVYHPTVMVRKTVFTRLGYYNENIPWGEDADLWYRIYDRVIFHNLPDPLVEYKVKGSLSLIAAYYNLSNKIRHLKNQKKLLAYLPVIIRDVLGFSLRFVKNY